MKDTLDWYGQGKGGTLRPEHYGTFARYMVKYLEAYKAERTAGETFSAWFGRTRQNGEAPTPEQFHIELTERAAKLAGAKVAEAG